MYVYTCKYCSKTFSFEKKNQPGAHVRNCGSNPKKSSFIESIQKSKNQIKSIRILTCIDCKSEYKLNLTDYTFLHGKYTKFCSRSCANTRVHTPITKNNISKGVSAYNKLHPKPEKLKIFVTRKCKECNTEFICNTKSKRKYCSNRCIGSRGGKASSQKRITRSKDEIVLYNYIQNVIPNTEHNTIITDGWDADIVLRDKKIAILWNGPFHYKEMGFSNHSLRQVQNRDKLKKRLFESLGWTVLVFEDRYYTPEKAFNEIKQLL